MRGARRREASREERESDFTPMLRALCATHPLVAGALFVDREGECIDYCSMEAPYRLKVEGAQSMIALEVVQAAIARLAGGQVLGLTARCERRSVSLRRVSSEYALVVVVDGTRIPAAVEQAIERAAAAFRREARVGIEPWDPHAAPLRVRVRAAKGWRYAPAAYYDAGRWVTIDAVLGRWLEHNPAGRKIHCYRVRTAEGVELSLAHDRADDRWYWHAGEVFHR